MIKWVYLKSGSLTFTRLSRGVTWLDTGNPASLSDATDYVRIIEFRTGLKIACLEEIAFANGWIDLKQLSILVDKLGRNEYSIYLPNLIDEIVGKK